MTEENKVEKTEKTDSAETDVLKNIPKIEVFKGKNAKWYWHLRAANGEIVCNSEAYETKQKASQTAYRLEEMVSKAAFIVLPESVVL